MAEKKEKVNIGIEPPPYWKMVFLIGGIIVFIITGFLAYIITLIINQYNPSLALISILIGIGAAFSITTATITGVIFATCDSLP